MFRKIPFTKTELEVIATTPGFGSRPGFPIRNTPVTPRENMIALYYDKKPFWMPYFSETRMLGSKIYSTHLGRGLRADVTDVFGIEWEFVESAGGSIVRPGTPLLDDVNNWKEKIKIPDISGWGWEEEAKEVQLDPRFSHEMSLVNGYWFERLISFMDFMEAAVALIDEEQQDAIKELFEATTDLACKVVDKLCELYPLMDFINVHDDWGSQAAPFFSEEVAYDLFVPFMKKLTDHIHSWGRKATLHSCGHNETRVQCFIDGGFDMWAPQNMNNIKDLYDRYGDKMIFAVWPDKFDPETTSEEEQRRIARKFVDDFSVPGKPAILSHYGSFALTPAFSDEMYEYSRKKYAELFG